MSRKALLKRKPRQIDVDGEPVWIRSMTLGEALKFDDLAKGDAAASLRFLAASCIIESEAGEPSFSSLDDPAILDIPTDTLRIIGEKATRISGSGKVDGAEKN